MGQLPEFRPHPFVRGGHAQTLVGNFLPGRRVPYRAVRHSVRLDDGDTIVLHDDVPVGWRAGGPAALLVHGLAGSHLSPYMVRVAARLADAGVRPFRMDLRGCGAGAGLARLPYHAGRSADVLAALVHIGRLCPGAPLRLIGFSLGGNIVLKLLGETPRELPGRLDRAVAVNPCIDLAACVAALERPVLAIYDRHFLRLLYRQVVRAARPNGGAGFRWPRRPRCIRDFDDLYTAPVSGFGTADDYYARCSAARFIGGIRVPTLVIASRDDPLVPVRSFEELMPPSAVRLHLADSGGHLGYIARPGIDPDRRWMDWRVLEWITF
jgi:uncharacterized protein